MPMRRNCAGNVDEVHQASAQKITQRIGIIGQYHLCHLRL
jgi:hypothetical protein